MSIFDVSFDPFNVTLNSHIWETHDPYILKVTTQNSILNMINKHGKLILGYSGGMDSGFILCCIRDLLRLEFITEDQIEIATARYLINGEPATIDFNRSMRFAKKLGFNPRIDNLELNEEFLLECMDWGEEWKIPDIVSLTQNLWRMRQSHPVIKGDAAPGHYHSHDMSPVEHSREYLLTMTSYKLTHHIPYSNSIDIWDYDNEVFSALCSSYWLHKGDIDYEPFGTGHYGNPFNPIAFNERLPRIILTLQCYPELTEIFFKFPSFSNKGKSSSNNIMSEAREYYNSKFSIDDCTVNVCLPNEKPFKTIKEVEDYFVSQKLDVV